MNKSKEKMTSQQVTTGMTSVAGLFKSGLMLVLSETAYWQTVCSNTVGLYRFEIKSVF